MILCVCPGIEAERVCLRRRGCVWMGEKGGAMKGRVLQKCIRYKKAILFKAMHRRRTQPVLGVLAGYCTTQYLPRYLRHQRRVASVHWLGGLLEICWSQFGARHCFGPQPPTVHPPLHRKPPCVAAHACQILRQIGTRMRCTRRGESLHPPGKHGSSWWTGSHFSHVCGPRSPSNRLLTG